MMTKDGIKDITTDELFKGKVAAFGLPAPSRRPARPSTYRATSRAPRRSGQGVDKIVTSRSTARS
jgi:hypothetical protein